MTLQELLAEGEMTLEKAGVPEAKINAWHLFAHVTGMTRSAFFLKQSEDAEEWQERYEEVLRQRMTRKPLEHITHETEFMGLPFYVDENVLIPRQDTECLVEEILPLVKGMDVLDLCTGSGCIGISLAVLGGCRSVTLADLSEEALAVAEKNAQMNHVVVTLVQSDLFRKVEGTFGIIVSNPPYIPTAEVEKLMPEVRDHEPHMALDGDADGLLFYRRIIRESSQYLRSGGWLCFEIGFDQGKAVSTLMKEAGYARVTIKKDLAGLDRIAMGQCPGMEESDV